MAVHEEQRPLVLLIHALLGQAGPQARHQRLDGRAAAAAAATRALQRRQARAVAVARGCRWRCRLLLGGLAAGGAPPCRRPRLGLRAARLAVAEQGGGPGARPACGRWRARPAAAARRGQRPIATQRAGAAAPCVEGRRRAPSSCCCCCRDATPHRGRRACGRMMPPAAAANHRRRRRRLPDGQTDLVHPVLRLRRRRGPQVVGAPAGIHHIEGNGVRGVAAYPRPRQLQRAGGRPRAAPRLTEVGQLWARQNKVPGAPGGHIVACKRGKRTGAAGVGAAARAAGGGGRRAPAAGRWQAVSGAAWRCVATALCSAPRLSSTPSALIPRPPISVRSRSRATLPFRGGRAPSQLQQCRLPRSGDRQAPRGPPSRKARRRQRGDGGQAEASRAAQRAQAQDRAGYREAGQAKAKARANERCNKGRGWSGGAPRAKKWWRWKRGWHSRWGGRCGVGIRMGGNGRRVSRVQRRWCPRKWRGLKGFSTWG